MAKNEALSSLLKFLYHESIPGKSSSSSPCEFIERVPVNIEFIAEMSTNPM